MQDAYEIEERGENGRDAQTTPRRAISKGSAVSDVSSNAALQGASQSRCILEADDDGPAISPVRTASDGFQFDFARAWGDAGVALEFGQTLSTKTTNRTGEQSRGESSRGSPSRESRSYGSEREGPPSRGSRQQGRTSREASLSVVSSAVSGQSDSRASTISMSRSQFSAISSSYSSNLSAPSSASSGQRLSEGHVGRWQPSSGPSPETQPRNYPPGLGRSQTLGAAQGLNRDATPFRPAPSSHGPPGLHARANTDMGPIQNMEYGAKGPLKENVAANTRKNTVFVKGFDYEVSKDTLYKYFSTCGDITNIALPRCRKRGRSRRLAWITFESANAVEAALRCDGSVLNTDPKRVLQISIAQPPRPKNSDSAKKDEKQKANKKRGRTKQQHPSLVIGDVVLLDLSREGVVKYIGTVRFAPGEWIGIELNNHHGKHNGVINGYRYFQCSNNKGIFVKRNRIRKKIGHDPQISRQVQFGPTYESASTSQFGYRKKVCHQRDASGHSSLVGEQHSRNVSLMDSDTIDSFPEFRAGFGGEPPQSRPTSSKGGPPFQREFGTRRPFDGPFGQPPAGFGILPHRPFPQGPPHRNNKNTLSGPPPHPPHGRLNGLAVRRPMPVGPPNAFDMSHFAAHLGPPGPGPSRGPNRSPPGIQPRSLSGVVSLDDAPPSSDASSRDLSPPRGTPSPGARQAGSKAPDADEPSELMVSG